jgi:hypothetical protein
MNQKHIDVINICLDVMLAFENEKSKADIKEAKVAFNEMAEKATPKPPTEKVNPKYPALGKMYYCTCGVLFTGWGNPEAETNFCGNCGQKIKGDE